MVRVRRLVAEQIAVCPGVVEGLVIRPLHLPQGEGHGAVGVVGFDGPKEAAHAGNGKGPVLTALENEGAKAQPVALGAAGENILVRQAVAVTVLVRPADAAVVAVVAAEVADLDETAGVDLCAVNRLPRRPGQRRQTCGGFRGAETDELGILGLGQLMTSRQPVDQGKKGSLIHRSQTGSRRS